MYWPTSSKLVNLESIEEALIETRATGDSFEDVGRPGRT